VYGRILGPVYDNEKENWRILTNKEIYAIVKKPTITETIRLHRLRLDVHRERKKVEFPKEYYSIYEFGKNKTER
jgi:CHAD domain-containing protein